MSTTPKNEQNSVKNQAKQVSKAVSKNLGGEELILEPGVLEYVVRSQAKAIKNLNRIVYGVTFALIIALFIIAIKQDPELPEPKYFASYTNGGVKEIVPLSEPITNTTDMRVWTEKCILRSLELSFTKPISAVNEVMQECFSSEGQVGYVTWLLGGKSSQKMSVPNGTAKNIEIPVDSEYAEIITKSITMNASPIAPSRIKSLKPLIYDGESIARWDLELPVVVQKFEGTDGRGAAKFVVKVTLKRTTNPSRTAGVDLDSWSIIRG